MTTKLKRHRVVHNAYEPNEVDERIEGLEWDLERMTGLLEEAIRHEGERGELMVRTMERMRKAVGKRDTFKADLARVTEERDNARARANRARQGRNDATLDWAKRKMECERLRAALSAARNMAVDKEDHGYIVGRIDRALAREANDD